MGRLSYRTTRETIKMAEQITTAEVETIARQAAAEAVARSDQRREVIEHRTVLRRTLIHLAVLAAGFGFGWLEYTLRLGELAASLTTFGPFAVAKIAEIGPEAVNEIIDRISGL